MGVTLDVIQRYPWLPSLKTYYADLASLNPGDFIEEIFSKYEDGVVEERILEIFNASFDNLEQISTSHEDDLGVYVYLITKILLFALGDRMITNRVANLYSKVNYSKLSQENVFNLYYICHDLGIDLLYNEDAWKFGVTIIKQQTQVKKTHFKLYYIDYLKLASSIKDEYRKLVNVPLEDGYVYILNKNLARLLQEYVRNKFLSENAPPEEEKSSMVKELLKNEEFERIYTTLKKTWEVKKEHFDYALKVDFETDKNISQLFPPCVKEILSKAQEGQNLAHTERLFIVWFLLSLEYPVDAVVDIFSTMPDFDREKTAYQVEFAKRKEYTPYKCETLKSYSLCRAKEYKDEICLEGYYSKTQDEQKKISHPLSYIKVKNYREQRKQRQEHYTKKKPEENQIEKTKLDHKINGKMSPQKEDG